MAKEGKYYDRTEMLCNGHVLIYTIKGSVYGRWNIRIKLPGRTGYIRSSLRTSDVTIARFEAESLYLELRAKHDQAMPLDSITFKDAFQRYADYRAARGRNNTRMWRAYKRYFKPYFIDRLAQHPWRCKTLNDYKSFHFDEYFRPGGFRMAYWVDRDPEIEKDSWGRDRTLYVSQSPPTNGTINLEKYYLSGMFQLAREHGYISIIPSMPPAVAHRGTLASPRGFFTVDEYKELYEKLRENVDREPITKNNCYQIIMTWRAERMRAWVLLQSATGLRTQEMKRLRWKHLKLYEKKGKLYTMLDLPAHITKAKWTGSTSVRESRKVFSFDGPTTYYRVRYRWGLRWCQPDKFMDVEPDVQSFPYMKHVKPDDKGWIPATWQGTGTYHDREALIFPSHKNKDKVVNMGVMFNRLLKEINLDRDEEDRPLCLTSLRHFFVTQRLQDGVPAAIIAKNCGHSIETLWRVYQRMMMTDVVEYLQRQDDIRGDGAQPIGEGIVAPRYNKF